MERIGVIMSTKNREINENRSPSIWKGTKASLKIKPIILIIGAINIPKMPGFKKNPINLLNGEDIDIMYPRSKESLKTTKLSITCIILSI
jgi:hypothetical protein